MLLFLQNSFSRCNFYYAKNGKQALDKLESIPFPDLIICDVMMDVMDGYTFQQHISEMEKFNSIPFIFLTAKSMENDRLKGLSQGAIDYISKPFSIKELTYKINSLLENRQANRISMATNIAEDLKDLFTYKNTRYIKTDND